MFEVFFEYRDYANQLEVYVFENRPDGKRAIVEELGNPCVTRLLKEGESIWEPTFSMHGPMAKAFLQAFANCLDKMGVKPEGKPVLENELTATKYHLEDMRNLVFKRLTYAEFGF